MIPGYFLARLAKFQGIVSVNDFWFPCRLQELSQALLALLEILFCMGRIVTTALTNLVPPRHVDDCYAIHFLH